MHLLVTGGAGFIGSHFVLRHLRSHPQDRIVVLDALTYAADRRLLAAVEDHITFVHGDITDVALLLSLTERHGIDTIVNFAAESHVDRSIDNALPFLHSNVLGVQALIELCRARPQTLLVHISTDEVYGDLADGAPPFTVDSALHPSSPYSATKAAGDLLLLAAARTYGIRVRITRCTNNFGPHQDRSKFIPVVICRALRDQPIPVYGKGTQRRDWLYVTDHTDAIEAVIARGTDGQVVLIGADDERENVAVARVVLELLSKPQDLIQFVADRPGHDRRYALDSSSARALQWRPQVSFQDGLRETIAWFTFLQEQEESESEDA